MIYRLKNGFEFKTNNRNFTKTKIMKQKKTHTHITTKRQTYSSISIYNINITNPDSIRPKTHQHPNRHRTKTANDVFNRFNCPRGGFGTQLQVISTSDVVMTCFDHASFRLFINFAIIIADLIRRDLQFCDCHRGFSNGAICNFHMRKAVHVESVGLCYYFCLFFGPQSFDDS